MKSTEHLDAKHLCESGWLTLIELVHRVNQELEGDLITQHILRNYAGRGIIDFGVSATPLKAAGVKGKRHVKYYPPETIDIILKTRHLLNEGWSLEKILLKKKENEEIFDKWVRVQELQESPDFINNLEDDIKIDFINDLLDFYRIYRREEKFQNKEFVTYQKFLELKSKYRAELYFGDKALVAEMVSQNDVPKTSWETFHILKLVSGESIYYPTFSSAILSDQIPPVELPPYPSSKKDS